MNIDLLEQALRLLESGETAVLATLVDAHGSTPQKAGAALLLRADGSTAGTLGGGCIEAEAIEAAREAQRTVRAKLLDFELTEDIAVDYGLACGGNERIFVAPLTAAAPTVEALHALKGAATEWRHAALAIAIDGAHCGHIVSVEDRAMHGNAGWLDPATTAAIRAHISQPHARPIVLGADDGEVYVEPVGPPAEVIVVGAGHVGRAVATAAKFLSYRVTVIDDRDDFANHDRFPDVDAVIADDIERAIDAYGPSPSSAIVIVTRGHKHDYQALSAALRSPAFYVGLMGSRRKVALIFRQLVSDGYSPERLEAVRAPIGLNIGAATPEEIAVSIVAEITRERLGGDGTPMKVDARIIEAAARTRSRA